MKQVNESGQRLEGVLEAAREAITDPPKEFSVMPFWFWNDALDHGEIVRQIADFQRHGVHGFVIHPRIGLPKEFVWMSDEYLDYCETAVQEAAARGMSVILYDEGMYPSGSAAGQVVAADSRWQARCLAAVELAPGEEPLLQEDEVLAAVLVKQTSDVENPDDAALDSDSTQNGCQHRPNGTHGQGRVAVIERPAASYIRGLHYLEDGNEELHLAADILNPDAVECFVQLVYERYAQRLGRFFGTTILGIFTDEPQQLARCQELVKVLPGMRKTLENISRILGYDFTPHLLTLWYDDEPDAERYRSDYAYAIAVLHNDIYYARLQMFCQEHNLALTGHPAEPDDTGALKYFGIPGQDVVLRWVLPDELSSLEGSQSTQAKCTSSIMAHTGRRRNLNEFCGGFGSDCTWEEMNWVAKWLLIRGVNLLVPHAFYYSVRGPRVAERPPQLGPHAPWWSRYAEHADFCRRLCWLNTDSQHQCRVAILSSANGLPWRLAKVLYENQVDFNYLDEDTLLEEARVDGNGIWAADMHYDVLIVEAGFPLRRWGGSESRTEGFGISVDVERHVNKVLDLGKCKDGNLDLGKGKDDDLKGHDGDLDENKDLHDDRDKDALTALHKAGRSLVYDPSTADDALEQRILQFLRRLTREDSPVAAADKGIRVRTVIKVGIRWTMLFNEVGHPQQVRIVQNRDAQGDSGPFSGSGFEPSAGVYNPLTDTWSSGLPQTLELAPYELLVVVTT